MTQTEWAILWILGGISVAQILEYFSMSGEGIIIMTVMLILDFVFGIISAKARGEKIESKKRERGLVKKFSRWLLPFIVVAWLKRTGMGGIEFLVNTIVGMIVFSELYSIIGHIYSINYGSEIPEADAFKMLLNGLLKFIKNLIEKKSNDLDSNETDGKDDTKNPSATKSKKVKK